MDHFVLLLLKTLLVEDGREKNKFNHFQYFLTLQILFRLEFQNNNQIKISLQSQDCHFIICYDLSLHHYDQTKTITISKILSGWFIFFVTIVTNLVPFPFKRAQSRLLLELWDSFHYRLHDSGTNLIYS